jgi:hypothetical protein
MPPLALSPKPAGVTLSEALYNACLFHLFPWSVKMSIKIIFGDKANLSVRRFRPIGGSTALFLQDRDEQAYGQQRV